MDTITEKNTATARAKITVSLRNPKEPSDKAIIRHRIDAMTSVATADDARELAGVYSNFGIPINEGIPFPGFDRMRLDHNGGKFDILLTEPPHHSYRDLDAGMNFLLELQGTGADIIFTNGQTMPELLANSVFRSTLKTLVLMEAVTVQELTDLCGGDDTEFEQPVMFF